MRCTLSLILLTLLLASSSLSGSQEQPATQAGAEQATPDEKPAEINLALVGGTIHTMEPGVEPRVGTLLIGGDRIIAIRDPFEIPPGIEIVDATGKHLFPGLIDAMVGFDADHDALYLRAGITLVRDIGSQRIRNLDLRATEARDYRGGPALLVPGAPLDGDPPSSPEAAILRDPSAAGALLPIVLADDPDYISILRGLSPEVHAFVLARAKEAKLDVWGPVPNALTMEQAVAQGQRSFFFLDSLIPASLNWSDLTEEQSARLSAALAQANARVVPALEASALRLVNPQEVPGAMELLYLLAQSYETWWLAEANQRVPLLSTEVLMRGAEQLQGSRAFLQQIHAAGVQLVPGSGAPNPWLFPGTSLHAELKRWVEAGIARETVLDLATRRAAEALGQGGQRGQLTAGYIADILVLDADPRANLNALGDPSAVVLRGRVYPREEIETRVQAVLKERNKERTLARAPIPVENPPGSENGNILISGYVESWALGQRVSAERFHVERLDTGVTRYISRIVEPGRGEIPTREMIVRQDVVDGALVEFSVAASDGTNELVLEGLWTAGSFRMHRLFNGGGQDGVLASNDQAVALDLGSVTSLMIIARKPRTQTFPMLTLHEALTPESVHWQMLVDTNGDFQVGTPTGALAFRLNAQGVAERSVRVVGRGTIEGVLTETDSRGGPGYPVNSKMRRWIGSHLSQTPNPEDTADDSEGGAPASGGR
ncbi:MAG: hypothetical protein ACI8QS_002854 [Planctomycetota bacterium]|jgi:hypothetical protein